MPVLAAQPANWKKWLVQVGTEVAGAVAAYFISSLDDNGSTTEENLQWRRLQIVYRRLTPSGLTEDSALYTIDVVNLTGGNIDPTWTSGDYTSLWTAFSTYLTAIQPYRSPTGIFDQGRAYRMSYRPGGGLSQPFNDSGPPENISDWTDAAGTGTGVLPHQVAMSVTERTNFPKHWGRFYLPNPAASTLDTYGRFTATARDAVATAVQNLFASWQTAGFFPVVPITQVDKAPARGLLSVSSVSVDDIPDVQRRRRAKMVGARSVRP